MVPALVLGTQRAGRQDRVAELNMAPRSVFRCMANVGAYLGRIYGDDPCGSTLYGALPKLGGALRNSGFGMNATGSYGIEVSAVSGK